jgi:hypothetical protein
VLVSLLFLLVATTLAVVGMLLFRRYVAPPGGVLSGMESADGIFSAAGAGLAVLLAFVIFTVFDSYQHARTGAGTEAVATQQLYATAGYFDQPARDALRGDTICYAVAVVDHEWPDMSRGVESPLVQHWVDALDATMEQTAVVGQKQGSALQHWFDVSQARQEGRRTRLAEATPYVPVFVWFVLVGIVLILLAFQCLFADPTATALGQAVAMASMAATLFAALTLIWVLDRPFNDRGAQIAPARMNAALRLMQHSAEAPATLPCDTHGNPR